MPIDAPDPKADAVVLIAAGRSTVEIGRELGVDRRTVARWRDDPAFEADVAVARRALLNETVRALGSAAREAVETLREALRDDSATIRVRAAATLLSALPAIAEHVEYGERIAALEARFAAEGGAV